MKGSLTAVPSASATSSDENFAKNQSAPPSNERRGRSRNVRQGDKGARTRQLIKEALVELLARKHVDDIVLEDICQQTGLTVGAFYFHFKNKDAALEEVAIDALYEYYEQILAIPQTDSLPNDIAALCAEMVAICVREPSLIMLMSEGVRSKQAARGAWMEAHQRLLNLLVSRLAVYRGHSASEVHDNDHIDAQFSLMAAETYLEHAAVYREPGLSLLKNNPSKLSGILTSLMIRSLDLATPDAA